MSEDNEKIRISKTSFQEWLEKLQQESWQLELLISGFALFAIWEARVLVDVFDEFYELQRGGSRITELLASYTALFLGIAWRIFFFNLLIHVLARGMWIGAIGLRYVSSEINYDYFNYAANFDNFLRRKVGDFDDYIEKLERFSSVIFAYTFLLFFIFLSLILFFAELGLVSVIFKNHKEIVMFGNIFLLTIGFLSFLDFITMGGIKRIKEKNISKVYFFSYRIFSFLTLSFLYRPLLYNFWDEKYTRRLFLFSIPYILILTILPNMESEAFPFFPIYHHRHMSNDVAGQLAYGSEYYDDERNLVTANKKGIFQGKHTIKGISLPSIELKGNYGWFFLRSYPDDTEWLENKQGLILYKKTGIHLKHWRDTKTDSLYETLLSQKSSDKATLIKKRIALSKALKTGEISQLQTGLLEENKRLVLDMDYWSSKKDSIDAYWQKEQDKFQRNKLQTINKNLLDLAKITIDSIPYNDKCDCKFYIHPNSNEKGLRCYFPMKALAEGPHTLHLERKRHYDEEEGFKATHQYYVPFYKIMNKN